MANDDLSLDIGDVLQLQFLPDETQERHYVKVIGYLQDQSLIVSTPHTHGKVKLMREGQKLAVRLLSGNSIMAFTVSVLRSCGRPYPYLHLSYPKELQAITVRKAQRVNFRIKAEISSCGPLTEESVTPLEPTMVDVEDMSTTGALVIYKQPIAAVKDLLSMRMQIKVANFEEELTLISIVRNVRKRTTSDNELQYLHGIEFQFAERNESIILHAFVYEQIVSAHD